MTYTYNATLIPRFLCGLVIKDEITADVFTTACLLAQPGWDVNALPPHLREIGEEAASLLEHGAVKRLSTVTDHTTPRLDLAQYLIDHVRHTTPDIVFDTAQANVIVQKLRTKEVVDALIELWERATSQKTINNPSGYLYAIVNRSSPEQILRQAEQQPTTTPKRLTYMERVKQEMDRLTPLPELVGADG